MVATENDDPIARLHPDVLAAVVIFSERHADYAAALLDALAAEASRRGEVFDVQGLPIGFLLELGAIMQLHVWSITGVLPLLPVELPPVDVASNELNARVQTDSGQFEKVESATLSNRLLRVWLEHFSWTAPAILGVDVVLGNVDEEILIETVAQLLWNNRCAAGATN